MRLDMLLVLVGSGWMRHGYQGGRRDPVGIVNGRSTDRPLRGRRRGHTGIVSTRLPLQTRSFGASATTGAFYSLRLPLRVRSARSDTVTTLLQAKQAYTHALLAWCRSEEEEVNGTQQLPRLPQRVVQAAPGTSSGSLAC